jgi:spore coat polysaccharide biosynthesis predicted glycosyltransferase SpsG
VTNRFSVLFRCDASPSIGLGHVVRCMALADELRGKHDVDVSFAMRSNPLASEMVGREPYPVLEAPGGEFDQSAWLNECVHHSRAGAVFVDVRDDLSKAALDSLSARGIVIATLEDLSDRRFAADMAFYPPVPQVRRIDWAGFRGQLCVGWEWIILRSQFAREFSDRHNSELSLLIAMGGSDPAGLTLKAVRAVDRIDPRLGSDFEATIIVGAGFCHRSALVELLGRSQRKFMVREDVSDMSSVMADADLAICSFGMTAYELAATGVPSVYVCLSEDHAESASALVSAGMGVSVGVDDSGTETRVVDAAGRLLADRELRDRMSSCARILVDGRGTSRIAELLVNAMVARKAR